MANKLRIIPLGGLGEVGKNMMVLEYGRNTIIIDAGIMFPENDMLGIDFIIPDFNYLLDKKDLVRAIILTHGHEDHVGALPYVLQEIKAPIYATKLTRGLAEVKLKDSHLLDEVDLNTIQAGDSLALGPFRIEFFHVCHSIPDGVGLAIETPVGLEFTLATLSLTIRQWMGSPPISPSWRSWGGGVFWRCCPTAPMPSVRGPLPPRGQLMTPSNRSSTGQKDASSWVLLPP